MLTDLEIARKASLRDITYIAADLGIGEDDLDIHGRYKAKVSLDVCPDGAKKSRAKYLIVTAITPTPLGEGKTVTTIGLSQTLNLLGKRAICCIRQPSMGPTFGVKGGAAGGGYAQVAPMDEFNLHLTGDIHAVGVAHNLLGAFIENSLAKGNPLSLDPASLTWNRVVDVSDSSLRRIVIGLGGKENGVPRETGFDITVASELMTILALARNLTDLRERIGRIVVGERTSGSMAKAEDFGCAGAMTVLLKDAIKPTLMQTLENTPVLVHTGPFANIAHGNSSIIADLIASRTADYVITECGYGADIGAEKFFDIKCRASGLTPDAAVLVSSVRGLKVHSGHFRVVPGKPLDTGLYEENIPAIREGASNLRRQIANVCRFGIPVVVAINRFPSDTDREIETIRELSLEAGALAASESHLWAEGGRGGRELAENIVAAAESPSDFKFLYETDIPLKEKIRIIATEMYGAADVNFSPKASEHVDRYTSLGFGALPVCMATTPRLLARHLKNGKGTLPVREILLSAGAGFVTPLVGDVTTMPGLPAVPAGSRIDIDASGDIIGLS